MAIDLTGRTFGRLRVLRRDGTHRTPEGAYKARWLCLCDPERGGCGNVKTILGENLRGGRTLSCGCLAREYHDSRRKAKTEPAMGKSGRLIAAPTARTEV